MNIQLTLLDVLVAPMLSFIITQYFIFWATLYNNDVRANIKPIPNRNVLITNYCAENFVNRSFDWNDVCFESVAYISYE
jgi:hypothetical protein